MRSEMPETAVCLGCGYALRGLPEPVCPECGRRFDAADPSTYRVPKVAKRFRLTPAMLGGTGLVAYIACLFVLGSLDVGTFKGPASIFIQPILMVVGTVLAIFAGGWAWRRGERRIGTILAAAFLLLIIFTIHLPSYLALLDDIASAQAEFQRRSTGQP